MPRAAQRPRGNTLASRASPSWRRELCLRPPIAGWSWGSRQPPVPLELWSFSRRSSSCASVFLFGAENDDSHPYSDIPARIATNHPKQPACQAGLRSWQMHLPALTAERAGNQDRDGAFGIRLSLRVRTASVLPCVNTRLHAKATWKSNATGNLRRRKSFIRAKRRCFFATLCGEWTKRRGATPSLAFRPGPVHPCMRGACSVATQAPRTKATMLVSGQSNAMGYLTGRVGVAALPRRQ